jgi:hypothetical protein
MTLTIGARVEVWERQRLCYVGVITAADERHFAVRKEPSSITAVTYTRVELWRDVDNEADILCSVALTYGAKHKDVLDQIRGCLPANLPSDDAAFLTGLVIQAYLHRAI